MPMFNQSLWPGIWESGEWGRSEKGWDRLYCLNPGWKKMLIKIECRRREFSQTVFGTVLLKEGGIETGLLKYNTCSQQAMISSSCFSLDYVLVLHTWLCKGTLSLGPTSVKTELKHEYTVLLSVPEESG